MGGWWKAARVKTYGDLTAEGQLRRLRLLARDAITAYGIAPEGVRIGLAAQSFNTVFRVIDGSGQSTALRVGPVERIHAEGTEHVEAQ